MAMEDAIERLARAVEYAANNSAVVEIIKQRDQAQAVSAQWKRDAGWYQEQRDKNFAALETERRRTRALRVVIRKLKESEDLKS